jgi:hypothetical protein
VLYEFKQKIYEKADLGNNKAINATKTKFIRKTRLHHSQPLQLPEVKAPTRFPQLELRWTLRPHTLREHGNSFAQCLKHLEQR